jgi:CRISPR/Cas system-associated endonuclease Cas3-HD
VSPVPQIEKLTKINKNEPVMGVTYMMACGTERVKNVFSYQKRCTSIFLNVFNHKNRPILSTYCNIFRPPVIAKKVSAILQLNQGIRSTSHKIEEKWPKMMK